MPCGCTSRSTKTMSRQVSRKRTASRSAYVKNTIKATAGRRIIKRPAR